MQHGMIFYMAIRTIAPRVSLTVFNGLGIVATSSDLLTLERSMYIAPDLLGCLCLQCPTLLNLVPHSIQY